MCRLLSRPGIPKVLTAAGIQQEVIYKKYNKKFVSNKHFKKSAELIKQGKWSYNKVFFILTYF